MGNIPDNSRRVNLKNLKEDEKILKDIVQSINIAKTMNECFWIGDQAHKTIYVNPTFEKLSEYSFKECLGKECAFFFDEEGKKIIEEHHKLRTLGVSSQYEATMLSKSGKKIPLLISGAPTNTGGTMGIFTNLTQLKKLAQKDQLTQQIIKNSAEAIVVLNKSFKITLWNAGASKIFGYTEDEVLNKPITAIVPRDLMNESTAILEEANQKKFIRNVETKRLTKTGDQVDVNISITKVTDEKGKFIGYLVVYRDISQQKKTNIELQKRFEAIQDAYKELGLQKRQIDYLYEISNAATSPTSLATLSNLIVSAICLLTKCDGTVLRLYDPQKGVLRMHACIGVSQKWLTKSQFPLKNSLAEDAVKIARPLLIDNIQTSQKHKGPKLLKSHKFTTLILIPLILPDKIIGSISLYSTDPSKFRFIENDFLENFGKQCAMALYVKQLMEAGK
ncbi:MAG: PAS domain S-box protein [Candidatus Gracilibacteria bacterium]